MCLDEECGMLQAQEEHQDSLDQMEQEIQDLRTENARLREELKALKGECDS